MYQYSMFTLWGRKCFSLFIILSFIYFLISLLLTLIHHFVARKFDQWRNVRKRRLIISKWTYLFISSHFIISHEFSFSYIQWSLIVFYMCSYNVNLKQCVSSMTDVCLPSLHSKVTLLGSLSCCYPAMRWVLLLCMHGTGMLLLLGHPQSCIRHSLASLCFQCLLQMLCLCTVKHPWKGSVNLPTLKCGKKLINQEQWNIRGNSHKTLKTVKWKHIIHHRGWCWLWS